MIFRLREAPQELLGAPQGTGPEKVRKCASNWSQNGGPEPLQELSGPILGLFGAHLRVILWPLGPPVDDIMNKKLIL